MPRDAEIVKNDPPLINDFAVQRADGADLAMRFYQLVAVAGPMPDGGTNRVEIAVCSIPALLAMKGHALAGRYKQKDAYDIYYCVRNYPGGIEVLAQECRQLLGHPWQRMIPIERCRMNSESNLRRAEATDPRALAS